MEKYYLSFKVEDAQLSMHTVTIAWNGKSVEIYTKKYSPELGSANKWFQNDDICYTLSHQKSQSHYFLDEPPSRSYTLTQRLKELGHLKTPSEFCITHGISIDEYKSLIKEKGNLTFAEKITSNIYGFVSSSDKEEIQKGIEERTTSPFNKIPDYYHDDFIRAKEKINAMNL